MTGLIYGLQTCFVDFLGENGRIENMKITLNFLTEATSFMQKNLINAERGV